MKRAALVLVVVLLVVFAATAIAGTGNDKPQKPKGTRVAGIVKSLSNANGQLASYVVTVGKKTPQDVTVNVGDSTTYKKAGAAATSADVVVGVRACAVFPAQDTTVPAAVVKIVPAK